MIITDTQRLFLKRTGHLPGLFVIAVGKAENRSTGLHVPVKFLQFYSN